MKHCFLAICFFIFTVSLTFAQQATAVQTLKPTSESVNQKVATRLVENKLNSAGSRNYVAYVRDNGASPNSASAVIKKQEASGVPFSVGELPAVMTVSTATLLELHGMRNSAVSLCLQLPTKYRTHLPQCAEIFEHEIRLAALAKDRK